MDPVVIGGPRRLAAALILGGCAAALILLGFRLGWGIGWMAWIPALALLVPASALAARRQLRRADGRLEISDGRLSKRILVLDPTGGELELLPIAGAWAVVLHRDGREWALATWVGRATAERVAGLCGDLPRRTARRPAGDR